MKLVDKDEIMTDIITTVCTTTTHVLCYICAIEDHKFQRALRSVVKGNKNIKKIPIPEIS